MIKEYLLQRIHEIVLNNPGVDTPQICLSVNETDILDPEYKGLDLAAWLSDWHPEFWAETCEHVDELIESGSIVFVDSGNLYPIGYQGELS